MNINQNIEAAVTGLKAFNDLQAQWRANCKAGGYAKHFRNAPNISDDLRTALLKEIVRFDEDPVETLAQIEFELEWAREPEYVGRFPRLSDEEFDFATSRGISA